ncbi:hypothetical protein ZMTM_05250 [Methyloradius palustris]|uniref:Uncharacterized protein n=1 Tax=Methyloradius palustris TaxID=2778876 RepID=A0A8D5JQ92_9PROT|nr:hypothetical protein ZMTM_05250 [Methyloradius palustris]
MAEQIDWLIHEKPDYLISLPSNLIALVQYAKEHEIVLPKVKEIRTVGETVTSASRNFIETYWQTKVVDIYTCEEAGYLALQCPETGNYHVQSESIFLEIVNKDGNPCAVGEVGQVLITTLHNFVTPLIRYEVGDMAEFGELCSCGRGLSVIRKIHGRKRNRLMLPDGQSLFPYLGEHGDIARLTGVKVRQFQCIQHTLEDIELKLVVERDLNSKEQAAVTKKMQNNLGYPFNIRFSFHDDIPRGPTGKFEEFMSNIS